MADICTAAAAGVAFTFTVLYLCAMPFSGQIAATHDFVSYWAAGWQLVHHGNPYDYGAILSLQREAGLNAGGVLFMRNLPWALPLAWPLGFLGLRLASLLWSLILLACLFACVGMVRRMHGSPPNHLHWLGLAFTPALICLIMGQTALLSLLGLALFLRFNQTRPFAAGAALWLCALKPHLFLPFGAALAAWIVCSRAWKLLAGAAAALAVSSALAFALDPRAWPDYLRMMRSPAAENEFVPCLAGALRHWIWPQLPWAQYLPAALAGVWALVYFWRRRAHWDWSTGGGPLMLVSLLLTPYGWLYDQCLAIPALLHAAYATRSRLAVTVLALTILAADFELCMVKVASPLWLWTAPAWFLWYLLASGKHANPQRGPES